MKITDQIAHEIMRFRSLNNRSPERLLLSQSKYKELRDEIDKIMGEKVESEITYYYGIPLKISKIVELKVE